MEKIDEISHRVKALRQRSGMTQSELAKVLGVSMNYVSQLETGRKSSLGELTAMRLEAMEKSPIYKTSEWRSEDRRVKEEMGAYRGAGMGNEIDEMVELMRDLLADLPSAGQVKRKFLVHQVCELAEQLRTRVEGGA